MPSKDHETLAALLIENRELKRENEKLTDLLLEHHGGHQLFICPQAALLGDVFAALALDASVRDGDRIRCAGVGDLVRRFGIWTAEPVLSSPTNPKYRASEGEDSD